ncbi:hypothetical protein FC98_GL002531 [Lentilactobacillus kisonensis DSM 19906 = JCM 15041]|uniref:Major facilitator superfamily (MFS) profile domain-containing protein n=1 Tax=Lentilactobacillus kisonensis DSM 19906 = JCM 15041 TaxID=1423766 RepID=A0A0R1NPW1_9LACO|nr:hypothetical protein FC98_GL002531 [Lentilactobacillus kisonensis DSM 19906 = JCM 15041]
MLPPFIFEELRHINVGLTGLLVLGAPLGLVFFSHLSGNQNDGTKNARFSLLGLVIMASSLALLGFLSDHVPALGVSGLLLLFGIGGGYFQPANIGALMQSGSASIQGMLGSLQRMAQNIAIASGTAIGSTIINLTQPNLATGVRSAWLVTLLIVAIVIVADLFFTNRNRT